MKTLFFAAVLLLSSATMAQTYYGAAAGISLKNYIDPKSKTGDTKFGINDLFLTVPVGVIFMAQDKNYGLLIENQVQGTAGLRLTDMLQAGFKYDFSENTGVHILAGAADDIYINYKPLQMIQRFNAVGTFRLWHNNYMLQAACIKPAHAPATYYTGIGVIGLWEKL